MLDTLTRVSGPEDPMTLNTMNGLGQLLTFMNEMEEAERVLRRCLEARVRVLGPENGGTLVSMANLAVLLIRTEQWEEAEATIRSCLSIRLRKLGLGDLQKLCRPRASWRLCSRIRKIRRG